MTRVSGTEPTERALQFDDDGLMNRREASINGKPIAESDRRFHWSVPGVRPDDHPGLIDSPE